MQPRRVVITGLGVVSPNGVGVDAFDKALQHGVSGITKWEDFDELNFRCQIGGAPDTTQEYFEEKLPAYIAKKVTNKAILYGCLAGIEAWEDAGLQALSKETDYDAGAAFGAGALGLDSFITSKTAPIDEGNHKILGAAAIPQSMSSGASAYLNQILGFGNRVMSNSSACITGSEAISQGFDWIRRGQAKRMLCGGTEGDGRYIWGAFDAMRILCNGYNDQPEAGSRPMSNNPVGFVPGAGAGALLLEDLESAQERGAHIYAEVLGSFVNTGGQRNGGSMTAANPEGVQRCITGCITDAGIKPEDIDVINGHLTSTKGDVVEINNWVAALGLEGDDFPYINATKSMVGHCIGGAGAIELVATVLGMKGSYIHPNLNVEEVHPEILNKISRDKIPTEKINKEINIAIKSNFGFGDLNCCVALKTWRD